MKTAADGKEKQTQPVTAEEKEEEGQGERKVEGGMVDETATVEAREELGSPDLLQESHDGSHDASRDLDQSGQSMEAVDLPDTHEEL